MPVIDTCKCGHVWEAHMSAKFHEGRRPCKACDCRNYADMPIEVLLDTHLQEAKQPPQVEARRKTPEVVQREIRKFALDQAVKMMPYLRGGTTAEQVAAIYEDYILNGKADK